LRFERRRTRRERRRVGAYRALETTNGIRSEGLGRGEVLVSVG
jgi:hypothetical protein